MLGIVTADEQSNVVSVFIRKMVGMPACAAVSLGKYPPFASISTTCLPFATDTLLTLGVAVCPPPEPEKMMAPPMSTATAMIEITIGFILLQIKDRRYEADDRQTVDKVEEREHDHNEAGCFEEYASFGTVLNTE